MFSTKFNKKAEDGLLLEEIEIFNILGISQKIIQDGIDNVTVRFQLEHQIINQET